MYRIEIATSAKKQLAGLDAKLRRRISDAIDQLAASPRPPGAVKLVGEDRTWRVRVGDWRVLYEIRDEVLVVLVVAVAHRREAYR